MCVYGSICVRLCIGIVFIWNPFVMRLLNLRINFLLWTFVHILIVFFLFSFSHYVSAKFLLWPSSGDKKANKKNLVKKGLYKKKKKL